MSNPSYQPLIDAVSSALTIDSETAAFVLATLSTSGPIILADPSGRDTKGFIELLEKATGSKAVKKYCSDQTEMDQAFLDTQGKLHPLLICDRIEALSSKVQALLGEALRREENEGVILVGFVDSRAEAERLTEPLRMAFNAVVDLKPVQISTIKNHLQGKACATPVLETAKEDWTRLQSSIHAPHGRPVLADAISKLVFEIPRIDSQAVMTPPRLEFIKQLESIILTHRALLGETQDLAAAGDLSRQACVWVLAHRLLRIEVGGKTNVSIVEGAHKEIPSAKIEETPQLSHAGPMDPEGAARIIRDIVSYLSQEVIGRGEGAAGGDGPVIEKDTHGKPKEYALGTIRLIVTALFSQGHILFEDYPGTGKSFMVEKLSQCISDDITEVGIDIRAFRRIQCVPDLLPADLTGFESLGAHGMTFRPGPVFAYFVLLDEINRTTPKVQSALLEAMAEKRVSVGNHRYDLGCVFFVLATQNPLDNVGTYELPGAQLDRFIFKRRLGPVGDDAFKQIVFKSSKGSSGSQKLSAPKIPISQIAEAIEVVRKFGEVKGEENKVLNQKVLEPLIQNICDIVEEHIVGGKYNDGKEIPASSRLKEGSKPSPRSAQKLIGALKALAFIEGAMKEDLSSVQITEKHLRMIGQDYFTHRIFPVREDLGLSERNELVNKIITEAIARKGAKA
jgi:MoxR-like ATPase